jgi:hypothetical protein
MLGGSTIAAYFRSQSPLEFEFATHRPTIEQLFAVGTVELR